MNEFRYPLRILFWEATLKCNAYCEFCGSRCGEANTDGELSRDEICRVFDQIARRYDASQIMIDVSGGEPLMRRDLFEIMRYAVSLGFRWGLVTNGTLLTEDVVRALGESDLRTASISIDGLFELHDRIRSFPGSFRRIVAGVERLSRLPSMETIMITTVVSKHNISHLPEIRDYLLRLPIQVWRVCMVDPIGRAESNAELALDAEDVKHYLAFMKECRAMRLPFAVTASCSHYWGREELSFRDHSFQCIAGTQLASVLANGDIFVCSDVPKVPSLIQGNVRRDNLVDVWENKFTFFRDPNSRRKGKCGECPYYTNCRGDSLHTWDFEAEAPKFCMRDYGLEPEEKSDRSVGAASFAQVTGRYKAPGGSLPALRVKAQSPAKDRVLFSPNAVEQMFRFFRWGEQVEENQNEQVACLIGRLDRDTEQAEEAFLADVEQIVPLHPGHTSPDTLPVNPLWPQQGRALAKKLGKTPQSILLGFVHSHPNTLQVSMSLGDVRWHQQLCAEDWKTALTVIVNPQRKELAAYAGPAVNHVEANLLLHTRKESME